MCGRRIEQYIHSPVPLSSFRILMHQSLLVTKVLALCMHALYKHSHTLPDLLILGLVATCTLRPRLTQVLFRHQYSTVYAVLHLRKVQRPCAVHQ